jgi:hypothetical protein
VLSSAGLVLLGYHLLTWLPAHPTELQHTTLFMSHPVMHVNTASNTYIIHPGGHNGKRASAHFCAVLHAHDVTSSSELADEWMHHRAKIRYVNKLKLIPMELSGQCATSMLGQSLVTLSPISQAVHRRKRCCCKTWSQDAVHVQYLTPYAGLLLSRKGVPLKVKCGTKLVP